MEEEANNRFAEQVQYVHLLASFDWDGGSIFNAVENRSGSLGQVGTVERSV